MKNLKSYFKENLITGIVVVVPIAVIGIILKGFIEKLFVITKPLTKFMSFAGPLAESIVAAIILAVGLALFFFVAGILLKSYVGRRFKECLEKKLLAHIPYYNTISGVVQQLTGTKDSGYTAVEVDLYGNNNYLIGFLTDTLFDGRCVVYIPLAPIVNIGQLHIVPKENVKTLDLSLKDAADIISNIGFDSKKILEKKKKTY